MSTTEHKAGTIALATVRGAPDRQVLSAGGRGWYTANGFGGVDFHEQRMVADVRPLIVVDPSASAADIATQLPGFVVLEAPDARTLARACREYGYESMAAYLEAQTRLPEPPPVSNERAAELIRCVVELCPSPSRATYNENRAELLRFADQLEADR